jgi:hypothetical protein
MSESDFSVGSDALAPVPLAPVSPAILAKAHAHEKVQEPEQVQLSDISEAEVAPFGTFPSANLALLASRAPAFAHLLRKLEGIDLPDPTGWHVLVLQYVRPERVGSIILSDKTLQEDAWQNRIGLVLRLGADCWADRTRYPSGLWASPGDSVIWRKLDNAASRFDINGATLCFVNDDAILARGIDPLKSFG